jgi:hypothetical protein
MEDEMDAKLKTELEYGFGRTNDREENEALFEKIMLTHRERQLIRYLVEKYMTDSIEYSNLIFDSGIVQYELIMNRCLSILKKISKSRDKFWSALKERSKKIVLDTDVKKD